MCSPIGEDNYSECSVEDVCIARETDGDNDLSFTYKVDESYDYYINNWYIEMDLMCTPLTKISFMLTLYFVGSITGGLFAAIPDRIGRKKSVIYGMALSCLA